MHGRVCRQRNVMLCLRWNACKLVSGMSEAVGAEVVFFKTLFVLLRLLLGDGVVQAVRRYATEVCF